MHCVSAQEFVRQVCHLNHSIGVKSQSQCQQSEEEDKDHHGDAVPTITVEERGSSSLAGLDIDTSTEKRRQRVGIGMRREYSLDKRYIHHEESIGVCKLENAIQKAKNDKVFQAISDVHERSACYVQFLTSFKWKDSVKDILTIVLTPQINLRLDHITHFQRVCGLPNIVANLCQHYVGRYLKALLEQEESQLNALMVQLCNNAESLKVELYHACRDSCGCIQCSAAAEWEKSKPPRSGNRPFTCRKVQVLAKLTERRFVNFTPSYFNQCIQLAQYLPLQSPLVQSPIPPSDVRLMAPHITQETVKAIHQYKLKLPEAATGMYAVYVIEKPVECLQYVDGDGGYLVGELTDGVIDYVRSKGVPMQTDSVHQYTLIPFREKNHDAVELGHVYYVQTAGGPAMRPYGHQALAHVRRSLGLSEMALLVVYGADESHRRLLVEVFTKEKNDDSPIGVALGIRLVRAGLSYPCSGAPRVYLDAEQEAKDYGNGIHEFGEVLCGESLKPWNLKRQLHSPGDIFTVEDHTSEAGQNIRCVTVKNERGYLNQAHLFVAQSTIPGAGLGLFIRATPLHCRNSAVIPKGAKICLYSRAPLTSELEDTDYFFEVDLGRHCYCFDAKHYDGENLGRFVNQGGLLEGLKKMVSLSERDLPTMDRKLIREEVLQHVNVEYKIMDGCQLCVVARIDIQLTDCPQELFGNYGILEYWIQYVVKNVEHFAYTDPVLVCVMWCLLSNHSNWGLNERQKYLRDQAIPPALRRHFLNMPCPFPMPSTRKRSASGYCPTPTRARKCIT